MTIPFPPDEDELLLDDPFADDPYADPFGNPDPFMSPEVEAAMLAMETEGLETVEGEIEPASTELALDAPRTTPEDTRKVLAALYGADCPLSKDGEPTPADWAAWPKRLWDSRESAVAPRLHAVQRNRLFRDGQQWVSSAGVGPWKEPPKPRDAARMVANVIKSALDQRVQIITEQRPGFRTKPTNHDPAKQRQAEAQQQALEYQFDQQQASQMIAECAFWSGTDGVTFPCLYWDADRGPWFEVGANIEGQAPDKYQGGDLAWMVYRIEQVRVSANATASQAPYWWVVKETIDKSEAAARYGAAVTDEGTTESGAGFGGRSTGVHSSTETLGRGESAANPFADAETVDRYTIYCRPTDPYLPEGLMMVVIGDTVVVEPKPLPWGIVPVFRWTDGSTDPAFYPKADMEDWISDQQTLNAALSKFVEGVRRNVDGRIAVLGGKVATETLIGGMLSVIEVKGVQSINDALQVIPGIAVAADVKELMTYALTQFERKSGWNDASRGSFGSDASGRSILAQREVVERAFARCVGAGAHAMATGWAPLTLNGMKWGYSEPRKLAITGANRGDLAVEITAETLDGICDVTIDPETMTPMPRSLKQFLLDQMLDKQLITPQEYRRRIPFAFMGSIESPDEDQHARAKVNAQRLREGTTAQEIMNSPEVWVFDEAIHQDVLQRDLLLPPDIDPMVKMQAMELWGLLANQAMMKQGGLPPGGDPSQQDQGGAQAGALSLSPESQPLALGNPSTAAAPMELSVAEGGDGLAQ